MAPRGWPPPWGRDGHRPLSHLLSGGLLRDLQLDNQLYNKSISTSLSWSARGENRISSVLQDAEPVSSEDLEEYKKNCFIKLCLTLTEGKDVLFDVNEVQF